MALFASQDCPDYLLSTQQVDQFFRDGYIHLKNVLDPNELERFEGVLTDYVNDHNPLKMKDFDGRSTYEKAFIQVINIWPRSEEIRAFVFSKVLARLASKLLKVESVRLYHDQALFKEPGGGITPWHADQYYWPLQTNLTCTAWIPLQETPIEMGPLSFSRGSHRYRGGRDLKISDTSEAKLGEMLEKERFAHVSNPFQLGDVSFHYGWTYHRAPPNETNRVRKAMTIIYMDERATVSVSERSEHEADKEAFLPERLPGELADTHLNPILYP